MKFSNVYIIVAIMMLAATAVASTPQCTGDLGGGKYRCVEDIDWPVDLAAPHCPTIDLTSGEISYASCGTSTTYSDSSGWKYVCSDRIHVPVNVPAGSLVEMHVKAGALNAASENGTYALQLLYTSGSYWTSFPPIDVSVTGYMSGLASNPLWVYYGKNQPQLSQFSQEISQMAYVKYDIPMGEEVNICLISSPNFITSESTPDLTVLKKTASSYTYFKNDTVQFSDLVGVSKLSTESAFYVDFYPTSVPLWETLVDDNGEETVYDFASLSLGNWQAGSSAGAVAYWHNGTAGFVGARNSNTMTYWAVSPNITVNANDKIRVALNYSANVANIYFDGTTPYTYSNFGHTHVKVMPSTQACSNATAAIIWEGLLDNATKYNPGCVWPNSCADQLVVSEYLGNTGRGIVKGIMCYSYADCSHTYLVVGSPPYAVTTSLPDYWSQYVSPVINVGGNTSVKVCMYHYQSSFGTWSGENVHNATKLLFDDVVIYGEGGVPDIYDPVYSNLGVTHPSTTSRAIKTASVTVHDEFGGADPTSIPDESCSINYANYLLTMSTSEEFSAGLMSYIGSGIWRYTKPNTASQFGFKLSCLFEDGTVDKNYTSTFNHTVLLASPSYLLGVSNTIKVVPTDPFVESNFPSTDATITGNNALSTVTGVITAPGGGNTSLTFIWSPTTKSWNSAYTFAVTGTYTLYVTTSLVGYTPKTTIMSMSPGYTTIGAVKDIASLNALEGVAVDTYASGVKVGSTTTNTTGQFSVVLVNGTYTFQTSVFGYTSYTSDSKTVAGSTDVGVFYMTLLPTYILNVHLNDIDTTSPLPGELVTMASTADPTVAFTATTNAAGIATFALQAGSWRVTISPSMYGAWVDETIIVTTNAEKYYALTKIVAPWSVSSPMITTNLQTAGISQSSTEPYKQFIWSSTCTNCTAADTDSMEYFNVPVFNGDATAIITNVSVALSTTVAGATPFTPGETFLVAGIASSSCSFGSTPAGPYLSPYALQYNSADGRFYLVGYNSTAGAYSNIGNFNISCASGQTTYFLFDMLKYGFVDSIMNPITYPTWNQNYIYSALGSTPIKLTFSSAAVQDPGVMVYAILNNTAETIAAYNTIEIGTFLYKQYPTSANGAVMMAAEQPIGLVPTTCTLQLGANPPNWATIDGNHIYLTGSWTPAFGTSVDVGWDCTFADGTNEVGTATVPITYAGFRQSYCGATPYSAKIGTGRSYICVLEPYTYFEYVGSSMDFNLTDLTATTYKGTTYPDAPLPLMYSSTKSASLGFDTYYANVDYFRKIVAGSTYLLPAGPHDIESRVSGLNATLFGSSTRTIYGAIYETLSAPSFEYVNSYLETDATTGEPFTCGGTWVVDSTTTSSSLKITVTGSTTGKTDSKTLLSDSTDTVMFYTPIGPTAWEASTMKEKGEESLVYQTFPGNQYALFYYHPVFGDGFPAVEESGTIECVLTINYGDSTPYVKTLLTSYTFDEDAYADVQTGNDPLADLFSTPSGIIVFLIFGTMFLIVCLILLAIFLKMFNN